MHPACELCHGACCESLVIPASTDYELAFLATRGTLHRTNPVTNLPVVELACRCSHLIDGKCGLYGKPERPKACDDYPVGSKLCRFAIERRRGILEASVIVSLLD